MVATAKIPQDSLRWIILMMLLAALQACGSDSSHSDTKNIFGNDDRVTPPQSDPYTSVGRLDSGCTGTVVGRRLILTAAHCIVANDTSALKPQVRYFRVNFRAGGAQESLWVEQAWLGSDKPDSNRVKDWAILKVDRDIAARPIRVDPVNFTSAALPYNVSLVGYSTDRNGGNDPSLARGCAVRELNEGRLFHDCDAAAGVSGGPLFRGEGSSAVIVGISVSEFRRGAAGSVTRDSYSGEYANVGIPAANFATVLSQLLATADQGRPAPQIPDVRNIANTNQPDNPGPGPDPDPDPDPGLPFSLTDVVSAEDLLDSSQAMRHGIADLRLESSRLMDFSSRWRFEDLRNHVSDLYYEISRFERAMVDLVDRRILVRARESVFDSYSGLVYQEGRLRGWRVPGGNSAVASEYDQRLRSVSHIIRGLEFQIFGRSQ